MLGNPQERDGARAIVVGAVEDGIATRQAGVRGAMRGELAIHGLDLRLCGADTRILDSARSHDPIEDAKRVVVDRLLRDTDMIAVCAEGDVFVRDGRVATAEDSDDVPRGRRGRTNVDEEIEHRVARIAGHEAFDGFTEGALDRANRQYQLGRRRVASSRRHGVVDELLGGTRRVEHRIVHDESGRAGVRPIVVCVRGPGTLAE